jgi:hypothetical protein
MSFDGLTGAISNLATSAGIVIGGTWAYFKFARGRTFARRAGLTAVPAILRSGSSYQLCVSITLTNAGQSRIPLDNEMKFVRVSGTQRREVDELEAAEWTNLTAEDIFDEHEWLEGQETVTDTVLFDLPSPSGSGEHSDFYKIEVIVGARQHRVTRRGSLWQTRSVVAMQENTMTPSITAEAGRC